MRYFLLALLLISHAANVCVAAPKAKPTKDAVAIDVDESRVLGLRPYPTAKRCTLVRVTINLEYTLVSQPAAFLRAAINLDGDDQFRSVYAKEVRRGTKERELLLEFENPSRKFIRVLVWLDRDDKSNLPNMLASDIISFDAKAILNLDDN